jgi:hypothetical protein
MSKDAQNKDLELSGEVKGKFHDPWHVGRGRF